MAPLGYIEVVPGDTLSGSLQIKAMSDTTVTALFNRAYYDVIVTYIPFRLLWSGFPDFLISGTSAVPTVTDLWEFNYEKGFNLPTAATATKNTAWLRRAHNATWNRFVRRADVTEIATDQKLIQVCSYRPSTFHEAVPEASSVAAETIDTSGSTLSVDDIRDAFNKDRFNKVKQYYGDRYVDYLAALGVQVPWTIQEAPELIGSKRGTLKYQMINPTNADTTTPLGPEGLAGGYFTFDASVRIKRKFFPEHGIVGAFALPKLESFPIKSSYPLLSFDLQEQYWSPERNGARTVNYPGHLWLGGADTSEVGMPQWEHLRHGANMGGETTASLLGYAAYEDPNTMALYKSLGASSLQSIFQDNLGNIAGRGDAIQIASTCTWSLVKQSPVSKRTTNPLV